MGSWLGPPKGQKPKGSSSGLTVVNTSSKASVDYDKFFKILVIGDLDVGKTSLILRYTTNQFVDDTRAYSKMDFEHKMVTVVHEKKKTTVKMQIWDTAGQEKFRTMTVSTFKGSRAILVGYDITQKKTWENVTVWLKEIQRYMDTDVLIFLFGNKTDLEGKRQVSPEEVQSFCNGKLLTHFDLSCKSGSGIEDLFNEVLAQLLIEDKLV